MTLRFSIASSMGMSWADLRSAARAAEECGFEEFLVADHLEGLMAWDENVGVLDGPTLLGALAVATDTLRLGILVSPVTLRHPVLLARALQTVDLISGGRVSIGLGAGWSPEEHDRFGFDFPKLKARVEALDEACEVIKSLWESSEPVHRGGRYPLRGAKLVPTPPSAPAPLLIAGASEASIRLAARHAVRWNILGTPAFVGEKIKALRAAESACGRTDRVVVTATRLAVFMENPEEFVYPVTTADGPQPQGAYALPGEEDRTLYVGPVSGFADEIAEFAAVGVDQIVLPISPPYDDSQIETYARACKLR